jgi:hypothetical protein
MTAWLLQMVNLGSLKRCSKLATEQARDIVMQRENSLSTPVAVLSAVTVVKFSMVFRSMS